MEFTTPVILLFDVGIDLPYSSGNMAYNVLYCTVVGCCNFNHLPSISYKVTLIQIMEPM